MAEEAPAVPAVKAPAKAPKKKGAPRAKSDGPSLPKLILDAVTEAKDRKGTSLPAIKKTLATKGIDLEKANKRINTAVKKLVTDGKLVQNKGIGASGSFKLPKAEPKVAKTGKKTPVKVKKPAAKSPQKKTAAKKTAVKKTAAKKTAVKKTVAKKPVAKQPAAKKSPVKKAAKKPAVKSTPKKAAPKKVAKKNTPVKKAAAKKSKK
ncbi:histone H1-like [Etheostoma cragini]|uniref:histone H1-like n=1 Tax=Etheostoma cragini TaxID=417921 RepID=UPI00155DEBD0|nr:histone H1-like [Etheostoma cragini]